MLLGVRLWQLSQECKKRDANRLRITTEKGHFMHRIIRITLMASVFTLLCTVGLGAEEAAGAVGDNVEAAVTSASCHALLALVR